MPNYGKPFAGLCVATAILLCGLTGYPVAPDILPDPSGTLDLNVGTGTTVAPGSTLTLVGDGFAAEAAVTISVYSQHRLLAEVVASAEGTIEATVQIPTSLEPGIHTVAALGNSPADGTWSLQTPITVVDATSLPFTGASIGGWALFGAISLIVGFVLIRSAVFGRRLLPE